MADYALANAWQQARQRLALLDDPELWAFGACTVAAWGRRPA
jgi:hypothetical protein